MSVLTNGELLRSLPEKIKKGLLLADKDGLYELHLRKDAPVTVNIGGENFFIGDGGICSLQKAYRISGRELDETVKYLCKGSVYSFEETIKKGYIPFGNVRVGVCTRLSYSGVVPSAVTSLNIRFFHPRSDSSKPLLPLFSKRPASVIVWAPPCTGKTTLLCDLAYNLSGASGFAAYRVAIADERFEFSSDPRLSLCDIYSGWDKALAIESATRTMSAQIVICDEIGSENEAAAILRAQNTGVFLVASAHAESFAGLYARPQIKLLLESGIFAYSYGLCEKEPKRLC